MPGLLPEISQAGTTTWGLALAFIIKSRRVPWTQNNNNQAISSAHHVPPSASHSTGPLPDSPHPWAPYLHCLCPNHFPHSCCHCYFDSLVGRKAIHQLGMTRQALFSKRFNGQGQEGPAGGATRQGTGPSLFQVSDHWVPPVQQPGTGTPSPPAGALRAHVHELGHFWPGPQLLLCPLWGLWFISHQTKG